MNQRIRNLVALLLITTNLCGCLPLIASSMLGTTLVVADRRSAGAQAEDEVIEWKGLNRVGQRFPDAHINVISYNRRVLVTGEAGDNTQVAEIGRIVSGVENVVGLTNEMRVGPPSTLSARAKDTYITSKIKARFIDAAKFGLNRIKVFTEESSVFLLGIATQAEANAAIEVARTTDGVFKVVNVMEIISEAEAKRLDNDPTTSVPSGAAK